MKKFSYYTYFVIGVLSMLAACKKNSVSSESKQNKLDITRVLKMNDDEDPPVPTEVTGIGWNAAESANGAGCILWNIKREEALTNVLGESSARYQYLIQTQPPNCGSMPSTPGGIPSGALVTPLNGPIIPDNGYYFSNQTFIGANATYFSNNVIKWIITQDMDAAIVEAMGLSINEDDVTPYNSQGMERIRYATFGALMSFQFGSTLASQLSSNMPFSLNASANVNAFNQGIYYAANGGSSNIQAIFNFFIARIQSHQLG